MFTLLEALVVYIIESSKWVKTRGPTWPTIGLGRVGLKFFYKF